MPRLISFRGCSEEGSARVSALESLLAPMVESHGDFAAVQVALSRSEDLTVSLQSCQKAESEQLEQELSVDPCLLNQQA